MPFNSVKSSLNLLLMSLIQVKWHWASVKRLSIFVNWLSQSRSNDTDFRPTHSLRLDQVWLKTRFAKGVTRVSCSWTGFYNGEQCDLGRCARVFTWNLWRPGFWHWETGLYSLIVQVYDIRSLLETGFEEEDFLTERLLMLQVRVV
jgi:hypothetical protein